MYVAVIVKKDAGIGSSSKNFGTWDSHLGATTEEAVSKALTQMETFGHNRINYEVIVGELTSKAVPPPMRYTLVSL